MKTFALSSLSFTGDILYIYNDKDKLVKLEIMADLSDVQHDWILSNIPVSSAGLQYVVSKAKNATIVEHRMDVTFDDFWDAYNEKERSSKKKSKAIWDKLSQTDRNKAYYYIPRYNRNRGAADKKYAETYLRAELWNN